jgi:hypothetical protein
MVGSIVDENADERQNDEKLTISRMSTPRSASGSSRRSRRRGATGAGIDAEAAIS